MGEWWKFCEIEIFVEEVCKIDEAMNFGVIVLIIESNN
jgi:hypothetical protein